MKKVVNLLGVCAFLAIGLSAEAQVEVLSSGDVGIGINVPTQKLHVVGNSFLDGNLGIGVAPSLTERLYVVGTSILNGDVGIGTTTIDNSQGWGRVLDLYDLTSSKFIVRSSEVKTGIFSDDSWNGTVGRIGTESEHDLRLMAGYGNDVITLLTNGNVGIGITNPTQKFQVLGNSILNGNVSIGSQSPSYKLDVNGVGRFYTNLSCNAMVSVMLGTYTMGDCMSPLTHPAIYHNNTAGECLVNGGLLLGTPSNWAHATYSKNLHYYNILQYADAIISPFIRPVLPDVSKLRIYQAVSSSKDFATEELQYVFSAEELQDVFPELVSEYNTCGEGDSGGLAINYIGMIPILTAAINEQQDLIVDQQERIDQHQTEIGILQDVVFGQELDLTELYALQDRVAELEYVVNTLLDNCCKDITIPPYYRDTTNNNNNNNIQQLPILYQNTPNPFTSNTEISCDIPAMNTNAFIYIYNLQGIELMSFLIVQTGYSTVYVYASTLPAGMYLYTLVVDSQIIDTKRMILTK